MAGFLNALKSSYSTQMQRHQNKAFLNATMAACALVATADGHVTFSETVRVDQIVEILEQLKAFNPVEAAELLICICLAVTEADGKSSLVDQIEIVTLCSLLELDPCHFGLYRG